MREALARHLALHDRGTAVTTTPQVRGNGLAGPGDLAADSAGLGLREILPIRGPWDQAPVTQLLAASESAEPAPADGGSGRGGFAHEPVTQVGEFAPDEIIRAPWYRRVGGTLRHAGSLWRAEGRPAQAVPAQAVPAEAVPAEGRLADESMPSADLAALEQATAAASAQVYQQLVSSGMVRTRADGSGAPFRSFEADPAREIVDEIPIRGDFWDLEADLARRPRSVSGPRGSVSGSATVQGASPHGQQTAARSEPADRSEQAEPTVRGLPPRVGYALEGLAPSLVRMVSRGVLGGGRLRLLAGLREAVVRGLVPAALPGAPVEVVEAVQEQVGSRWDSAVRGVLAPRDAGEVGADTFDGARARPLGPAVNRLAKARLRGAAVNRIDRFVGALAALTEAPGRAPVLGRGADADGEAICVERRPGARTVSAAPAALTGRRMVVWRLAQERAGRRRSSPHSWDSGSSCRGSPAIGCGVAGDLLPGLAAMTAAGAVLADASGTWPGEADRAALVDGVASLRQELGARIVGAGETGGTWTSSPFGPLVEGTVQALVQVARAWSLGPETADPETAEAADATLPASASASAQTGPAQLVLALRDVVRESARETALYAASEVRADHEAIDRVVDAPFGPFGDAAWDPIAADVAQLRALRPQRRDALFAEVLTHAYAPRRVQHSGLLP
jgi:hypothetical protein